ncbi:MAG TPA: class I SAM-dependent methyltransferase [Micromonosporaceae bacterium]
MDSSAWDARYAERQLVWGAEPNRFVVEELTDLPAGAALDLGAGEGRNALWLAGRGWRVTAVDFSSVAIDRGRALAATRGVNVRWVVADVQEYQPPTAAFDVVLVAYLHIPRRERARVLERAAAALVPGGRILVIGHDETNLRDGVGGPQDPTVLYSPEAITGDLPGLTVLRAERARRPVEVDGTVRYALDTVVCAARAPAER